jgi:hypothetical protein
VSVTFVGGLGKRLLGSEVGCFAYHSLTDVDIREPCPSDVLDGSSEGGSARPHRGEEPPTPKTGGPGAPRHARPARGLVVFPRRSSPSRRTGI